jgi:hypothetical protein
MIIVTGPYSSKDPEVKKLRVKTIAEACLTLMHRGDISISPLTFGLSLIEKSGKELPDSYEFWTKFCKEFVGVSKSMYVLNMDGWEESNGTKDEIKEAKEIGIPVYLVNSISLDIIKQL